MALTLDDTSIVNILMDATVEHLKAKLLTDVVDDAQAGLVRSGRLQDDPNNKKVNILIHSGGEEWPDVLNTPAYASMGMTAPTYIIGGPSAGSYWRRRFRVELQIFFTNDSNRNNARMKSFVALQRAHHALRTMGLAAIPADSFGEKAHMLQVFDQHLDEGGGEGDFNFRGEIKIEFLTEFEPRED